MGIGFPGVSTAATLNVPADYLAIQACIDAAVSGVDECVVAPGTYHETINFLGKAIMLRSSGGADVTTIDATGIGGSVAICSGGEGTDTVLDGFTITGGTGTYGGGMYNYLSSPMVKNCTFSGNGAVYGGGGIYNDVSSPTVTHCTFSGNTGSFGGGMYNNHSDPTVTNSTFSGNSGTVFGGGMYNAGSTPVVTNCTFGGNKAAYGSGMYNYRSNSTVTGSVLFDDRPDTIVNDGTSTGTVRFSNVEGGLPVGAIDAGGNIDLDPMFVRMPDPGPDGTWDGVDDDYGDLRLRSGSPCINAGDPAFVPQPAETDLEGHARVLCGRVDMGAYEFGIGDYDCDQTVDLADFSSWQACTTAPRDVRELALAALTGPAVQSAIDNRQWAIGCEAFDFDGDGEVDLADFGGFQRIVGP